MFFQRLKRRLAGPFAAIVGEDVGKVDSLRRLPTLPPEMIIAILSFVDNTPTLAACARVCMTMHELVIPILYRTIELGISRTNDYVVFFDSLQPSFPYTPRKPAFLKHLQHLILWNPPSSELFLPYRGLPEDLFPSLHSVQFHAAQSVPGSGRYSYWANYSPLFSMFHHIRHVCIHGYEGGWNAEGGGILYWSEVESFTYLCWKAGTTLGIPDAWRQLRQISVYPDLCTNPSPYNFALPDMIDMIDRLPNPDRFPLLEKIKLFVPHTDENSMTRLAEYVGQAGKKNKTLIDVAVEELLDDHWDARAESEGMLLKPPE